MRQLIILLVTSLAIIACDNPTQIRQTDIFPPIYPDYIDVTIPVNIAPLNFLLRSESEKLEVSIEGHQSRFVVTGSNKINIPIQKWKTLLKNEQGNSLRINVTAKINGNWIAYKPFYWYITKEVIDPYLSYRLIEPGYEVWDKLQIVERNIETFDERVIADNNLIDNSCINCHTKGNQNEKLSMFHIRGKRGGTILNRSGKLRKINTRAKGMIGSVVYGNFHPIGRYGVFSTNIVKPEFHTYRNERLEVYDSASDIVVLDFDNNETISQTFLSDSLSLETFPVFSACGKWIYFCTAKALPLPDSIRSLKYNLCRVSFDASTGIIGNQIDTLWNAKRNNGSVSQLKTSPDGRYILYTVSNYGTFPIWHREAELQMMDLTTGAIDSLKTVNGSNSDTYHSWSSNSRWFVFASKREDGIYGKPYFCYIDSTGKAYKPFLLPQSDPTIYDNILKSFNIPELSTGETTFDAMDIERAYYKLEEEKINPR